MGKDGVEAERAIGSWGTVKTERLEDLGDFDSESIPTDKQERGGVKRTYLIVATTMVANRDGSLLGA